MQTFLSFADFQQSAAVLDNDRLGKQRVECVEILVILSGRQPLWMSNAWYARCQSHKNHPAVLMWSGYSGSLVCYARAVCHEWMKRGHKDSCLARVDDVALPFGDAPWWLGYEPLHSSHRAILLAKRPRHYKQFGWKESPAIPKFNKYPYVWPTQLPADVVNQLKQNANNLASSSATPALNAQ